MNATIERHGLDRLLPPDLSVLIEKPTLMRTVFDALDGVQWPKPQVVDWDRTPEPVLRTLLVFCYATGVYSSREIAASVRNDSSLRYLCANDFPTGEEVRRFRRQYLPFLSETLARLFHSICTETQVAPNMPFFRCVAEAQRRLIFAVEADSAAMDAD